MLPVFVYGTLRTGSWNHDRWLAPWLAAPCRPARLDGHALHHHDGLPYVVGDDRSGASVVGELATLDAARYDAGLARLDVLEDVAGRHYDRVRVTVRVDGGGDGDRAVEPAWVWVAGPRVAASLGPTTVVADGDFLAIGRR